MKQHERRFSSDIFIVYATAKMEDPRWGSVVLSGEKMSKRQSRQGTTWAQSRGLSLGRDCFRVAQALAGR